MFLRQSAVLSVSSGGWLRHAMPQQDYCGREFWIVICDACTRGYRVHEPADLVVCDCHAGIVPQPAA
jgi:hypothetical protein